MRGAFILFEGMDRCGKTTQANKLVEALNAAGVKSEFMRFPDRTTTIGEMLNAYLTKAKDLDDKAVHLLFSANRWEKAAVIESTLAAGTTIIMDRYAPSGVAFSAAKDGMTVEWCKHPDVGLPAPDKVFFLDLPVEKAAARGGFGGERYELADIQIKVREMFSLLKDDTWEFINADQTVEDLHAELVAKTRAVVDVVGTADVGKLWVA